MKNNEIIIRLDPDSKKILEKFITELKRFNNYSDAGLAPPPLPGMQERQRELDNILLAKDEDDTPDYEAGVHNTEMYPIINGVK